MSVKVNALPAEATPALTDHTINDSLNVTTKRTTWQKVLDMFIAAGLSSRTSLAGIVAAGIDQATATALTKTVNRVDTVPAGTGVVNSAAETAQFERTVQNNNAVEDLLWYPFLGSRFYIIGTGAMAIDAPITISPGNQASVIAYTNGILTVI